jgi:hypothetical protein
MRIASTNNYSVAQQCRHLPQGEASFLRGGEVVKDRTPATWRTFFFFPDVSWSLCHVRLPGKQIAAQKPALNLHMPY